MGSLHSHRFAFDFCCRLVKNSVLKRSLCFQFLMETLHHLVVYLDLFFKKEKKKKMLVLGIRYEHTSLVPTVSLPIQRHHLHSAFPVNNWVKIRGCHSISRRINSQKIPFVMLHQLSVCTTILDHGINLQLGE